MAKNNAAELVKVEEGWVAIDSDDRYSLIVPVFNEGESLEANLLAIRTFLDEQGGALREAEIIVVDDGSTDATAGIADRIACEDFRVIVFHHGCNLGLGRALETGFKLAQGTVMITLDSDLTYSVNHISALVDAAHGTGAQVVVTSPYMKGGLASNVPLFRLVLSWTANCLLMLLSGRRLSTFTGLVRLYRRDFLELVYISASGAEVNLDLLHQAFHHGVKVAEIPGILDWGTRKFQNRGRLRIRPLWRQIRQVIRYGSLIGRTCSRS